MGYCSSISVTPKMIRKGQVSIGDKIVFDDDAHWTDAAELTGGAVSSQGQEDGLHKVQAGSGDCLEEGSGCPAASGGCLICEGEALCRSREPMAEAASDGAVSIGNTANADSSENVGSVAVSGNFLETACLGCTEVVETAATAHAGETTSENPKAMRGLPDISGHISRRKRTRLVGAPAPTAAGEGEESSVAPHSMGTDSPTMVGIESFPLGFDQMTAYAQALDDGFSVKPTYYVPNTPMVPPEYDQALDYDSIQYLNGFLKTQLGRFVKMEQLVSSNIVTERSGFLVGVGSNYVLLQEITTGNIMVLDYYSVKFAYIYYAQLVFPTIVKSSDA